jgi:hypothetical protein
MFNNLIGKNKELGRFLFCERYTLPPVKNAMYIAEGQELKKGAVVDVNGYLIGTAGLQPYAVLEFDCDTRDGGKEASVFLMGEFNYDKLSFADGLSKDDMDNIVYNARKLGIVIKPYSFSLGFVPQADDEPENFEKAKKYATKGDAIYFDGDGVIHVIDGKSVNSSTITEGWTYVGPVAKVRDGKAMILNKAENTSVKFASCWQYEITGIKYNQSNTIQFQQAKTSGFVNIGDPFTFTPTDIDDAVDKIDEFLRDNAGGVEAGAGWNYNWHCEKLPNPSGVDSVVVVADNNVDYRQYVSIIKSSGTTTGITSNQNMCNFLTAYTTMLRNNSGTGFRVGLIKDILLEYYATNTTIANPTAMVPVNSATDIVSKTQFEENQYCADLRDAYGTFENYIESVMLAWPSDEGNQVYMNGTGKEYTELLAARKHKNLSGTEIATYPAATYSFGIGYEAEGLEEGNWYMPDVIDFLEIFKDMKVDGTDIINATQKRATGSAFSLSVARWLPARYSTNHAWNIFTNGASNLINFYGTYRACAVTLLTL